MVLLRLKLTKNMMILILMLIFHLWIVMSLVLHSVMFGFLNFFVLFENPVVLMTNIRNKVSIAKLLPQG